MRVLLLNPPGARTYVRDYFCSKTTKSNYLFHPIDLVVLSGHGRNGRTDLPCGRLTGFLLEHAPVPLLVVRDRNGQPASKMQGSPDGGNAPFTHHRFP